MYEITEDEKAKLILQNKWCLKHEQFLSECEVNDDKYGLVKLYYDNGEVSAAYYPEMLTELEKIIISKVLEELE